MTLPIKQLTLFLSTFMLIFSSISFAQDHLSVTSKIYSQLPTINKFEKFCVLTSESEIELESCINSQPKTELHKRALMQSKSRSRIDLLNKLAIDVGAGGELDGDPWFTFCLINSTPACLDACVNGWVCSSE